MHFLGTTTQKAPNIFLSTMNAQPLITSCYKCYAKNIYSKNAILSLPDKLMCMHTRLQVCKWYSKDYTYLLTYANAHHILFKFLPELKNTGHNTRKRVHNFVLSLKDDSNFIPSMLYSNLY